MKNPLTLRLLCLLVFMSHHLCTTAQNRFGIDFDAGMALPTAKAVNSIFYTGGNLSLGFKMAVLPNKRLWIKPTGGAKFYVKQTTSDNTVSETFRTWKAGIELQYKAGGSRKFSLYPLIRIDHNWCSNYLSKTYAYDPATNSQTIAISDNFLSGHGYSFDAGMMIVRSPGWYLKIDYEYFNPTLKVNTQFINDMQAEGFAVPSATKYNCSTLNIGLGINLNFK